MAVTLTLKKGREAATLRRHPWLFSGSVAASSGTPDGTVEARSHDGRFLARGLSSPRCPIGGCFLPFEDRPLNAALFDARVADALALRALVVPPETDGYRVIHAEGDGLPGLVVDKYGAVLVVQATTEGTEHARELWLPPLLARLEPDAVLQKNDLASRAGEGLPTSDELLHGAAVPLLAPFTERGLRLVAELAGGQKTGFFLDQRENRALVRELAGGRSVLNLLSYSGAFGVAALAGGAVRVTHVDASREALALARENHERNGQDLSRVSFVQADVFADLRARAAAGGEARGGIVLVGPVPPWRSGIADQTLRLARALGVLGAAPLVLTFRRMYPRALYPGARDRGAGPFPDDLDVRAILDGARPLSFRRAALETAALEPRLVVLPWWTAWWAPHDVLFLKTLAKRSRAVKLLLCHNVVDHEASAWKRTLAREVYRRADRLTAPNARAKAVLERAAPGRPVDVLVHPCEARAVLPERARARAHLGVPPDAPLFLFTGILRPYKGWDVLLAAFRAMRSKEKRALLV